jgi:probable addiction module antidote protein
MALELRYYQTPAGEQPFVEWLQGLKDRQARARIEARIARVTVGNFGDTSRWAKACWSSGSIGGRDTASISPGSDRWWSCSFAEETRGRSRRTLTVRKRTSRTTRRALRGKSRVPVASVPYEPWLIEQLKNPAEAAAHLEAVIEDGDQAALMLALRQVAQAQGGIAEIARRAKLTREATYKMLSKSGNPELRSLNAVLRATGLRIAVRPIEKRAA